MTIDTLFAVKHLEVSLAYRMPCLRRDCVEQNSEKGLQTIKTNIIDKDYAVLIICHVVHVCINWCQ